MSPVTAVRKPIQINCSRVRGMTLMISNNILEAMGHTPLIRLNHMTGPDDAEVLVKYEGVNVGGSIKSRTALGMIEGAEERGMLNKESVIVEPTSGNQGIGLAMVCAVKGYKCKIIMPDSVSHERRSLITQYGAEVILVHDEGDIGACMRKCVAMALKMMEDDPKVYVPNQFANLDNVRTQRRTTAQEILEQVGGPIHGFCSGFGTGGTLTGIGQVIKETFPNAVIWVAEPEDAQILAGKPISSHIQMGIGDGIIPEIMDLSLYDKVETVSDDEALQIAKDLTEKEGILSGISGGTNVAVALRLARLLGKGKTVVTVLPDTGERYITTPLFGE